MILGCNRYAMFVLQAAEAQVKRWRLLKCRFLCKLELTCLLDCWFVGFYSVPWLSGGHLRVCEDLEIKTQNKKDKTTWSRLFLLHLCSSLASVQPSLALNGHYVTFFHLYFWTFLMGNRLLLIYQNLHINILNNTKIQTRRHTTFKYM